MQLKMTTFFAFLVLSSAFIIGHAFGQCLTIEQQRNLGILTQASTNFSMALYKNMSQNDTSVVFSPYSIHTALTMAFIGATSNTKLEMRNALGLKTLWKTDVFTASATLVERLQNTSDVTMNVANGVFVQKDLSLIAWFKSNLKTKFKAIAKSLPEKSPETEINKWVAKKTNNMITNLFEEGSLDESKLVLVNAIYFKGKWAHPFDKKATKSATFHPPTGLPIKVEMMTQSGQFRYNPFIMQNAQVLELPYQGNRFFMYIILPHSKTSLEQAEQELTTGNLLNSMTETMYEESLVVKLPKFKTTSRFFMKETLKKMGMTRPFEKAAEFKLISSADNLLIDKVVHEAVIEVSEEGTEASGSTGVSITNRMTPNVFTANHAFIYLIRDSNTNVTLFMGKYTGKD